MANLSEKIIETTIEKVKKVKISDETKSNNILKKLKLGFLTPISREWFYLYNDRIEFSKNINDCDYLIYESNGDPIGQIISVKSKYPKNKLVFILSGDQFGHIDDECIWFTNAVKVSGLSLKQTQIFVSNPAIFKFYESHKTALPEITNRTTNIYFKGTIWTGMRTVMYNYFKLKPHCNIIANNNYWTWRLNSIHKPTQDDLEKTAFESYNDMLNAKLVLCPKGNGNSSMRILEALSCGAIPILIDDFSMPFGNSWEKIALVFDTKKDSWNYIYIECCRLLNNEQRMKNMISQGLKYFNDIIYGDSLINSNNSKKFKMYNDINTVCFGFSNLIVSKLEQLHTNNNAIENIN